MKRRSIGILGTNYCGSTMMSEFLSEIENSINIGESHWIYDREDYNLCMECKKKQCPVFSQDVIMKIRNQKDIPISESIYNIFGKKNIIFSDKNPYFYNKKYHKSLDGLIDIDCFIFIHKSIDQSIFSNARRSKLGITKNTAIDAVLKYEKDLTKILNFSKSINKPIYKINLENFHKDVNIISKSIEKQLNVRFDPNADLIRTPVRSNSHYIGGNNALVRQKKGADDFFSGNISKDTRFEAWTDEIFYAKTKNPGACSNIANMTNSIGESLVCLR